MNGMKKPNVVHIFELPQDNNFFWQLYLKSKNEQDQLQKRLEGRLEVLYVMYARFDEGY